MLWKADDELTQLRNKVAELEKQIGECHCDSSSSEKIKPFDRFELEKFTKQIEDQRHEEESEARWQREQDILQHRERFRNRNLNSPLERPNLYQPDEGDTRSKSRCNSRDTTIDWRGLPLIIGVIVLAWFWFNRPVESSSNLYPDSAQQTQNLR